VYDLEITPHDLKRRIDSGEKLHLIDVREPWEFAAASISGSRLIPMGEVPAALVELEARAEEAPLILLCHHGIRSLQVADWLRRQGVQACQSLSGGLDRWSAEIDPTVPLY